MPRNQLIEASPLSKQKSKSAKAKAAICEATIDCLVEVGYGKTSLNLVAAQAGFSKGALQHHFNSKEDLIIATANRLLQRTVNAPTHSNSHSNLSSPRSTQTVSTAILFLWNKLVNTPPYRALLEILTAARTDVVLRERVSHTLQEWNTALNEQAVATYYSREGDEEVRQLMSMTRNFLGGLIIHERHGRKSSESLKQVKKWITLIEPKLKLRTEKN